MDASKKQREPVAFKSLSELKRFIRPGVEFKTVSHANHADMVGLTRVVTTVQTVGFYSKIKDQPEHPFSTCNHGKGFYTDFGKAGNYIFDGTTVKVKDMPVYHYIKEYRLEQAAVELVRSRKPITEIAQHAGYDNASKFSESFKKRYGKTPSRYRADKTNAVKRSIETKTE